MEFCAEMLVNRPVIDAWGNKVDLKYTRLRDHLIIQRFTNASGIEMPQVVYERLENLKHDDDRWIVLIPPKVREIWRPKVTAGRRKEPYLYTNIDPESGVATVEAPQDGSGGRKRRFPLHNASRTVLSSFDSIEFPHILAAREEMRSWRFLELNPEDLRRPTSQQDGEDRLGPSGKNLAAVLHHIKLKDRYLLKLINRKLQRFLPNFVAIDVENDHLNKQFLITLTDKDQKRLTSRVLSEGTLRILALCVLDYDDQYQGLLCFEEPENGIHPLRVQAMADLLKDLSTDFNDKELPLRQVIVNTHSPVLARYINQWEDDQLVTIWYSQAVNKVTDVGAQRLVLSCTQMRPVSKQNGQIATSFSMTDEDEKLTSGQVAAYLSTAQTAS
jgi:AAA domain, putative AbiEii toxin, Type IV TA system